MATKKLNAAQQAAQLFQRVQQGAGQMIQNFTNNPIGRSVVNTVANVNPVTAGLSNAYYASQIPQVQNFANAYRQNQVIAPIRQGLQDIRTQPGIVNKGIGALKIGQGIYGATPVGAGLNVGIGGLAGGIRALRTSQPIARNIYQGATTPTDIAGQGLGIKNPILAGGIDLLAGGNPKSLVSSVIKGKGIVSALKGVNPKAWKMNEEDLQSAKSAVDMLRYIKSAKPEDKKYAMLTVQNLLEKYIPGHKYSNTRKSLDALEHILQANDKLPKGERTPFPKMGLVEEANGSKIPTGSVQSSQLPGEVQPLSKAKLLSPIKPPQGSGEIPGGAGSKSLDAPYFNTSNYNIPGQGKELLSKTVGEVKPQIEQAVGKTLSNKEAVNFANNSSAVLHKVVDRQQTLQWEGALVKARQALSDSAQSGRVDQSYIDNLLTIKTQGTDIARKLQSFSIGADPKTATYKDKILEAVLKVTDNTDKVLQAAQGVDFNDAQQAANFYRQFIKPTAGEWVDLVRYNSMLSSPLTHIVNVTSNAINSGIIAPIEKSLTGTIDFLNPVRIAKGRQQTQFASEGGAYLKGYYSKLGVAAHRFVDVFKGKLPSTNLDIRAIPLSTQGKSGQITSRLSIPTKLLEASDQFFTTLAQGGETGALNLRRAKGVNVGNIETQATENAAYRLFRSELHTKNQGHVLNSIDDLTSKIQGLRASKNPVTSTVAKFTIPFLKTPMNILKQGVEYSPAGFATIPGATNKTEQLSKAIMGSAGAAMAAMMITSGRTTWAEPTDPTNRARFRAAGLQPYAVKIGDKWISYQKLPPAMSFPLAFMSAVHDAQSHKTIDQSQADAIMSAMAKFGNFYSDQSYLKNIGDAISATKGSPENMTQFVGNYPQQLIPFRALLGWMARLTDPNQRKVNTNADYLSQQVQNLLMQIPGASQYVPARLDESGQPIPNQNRAVNAFSPFKASTERPAQKQYYDAKQKESLFNKNIKAAQTMMEQGKPVNFGDIAGAAEPTTQGSTLQQQMQDKITVKKVQFTGKPVEENGKLYYPKGKSVKTIDLSAKLQDPQFSGNTELDKKALSTYQSEITKRKNDVNDLVGLGKLTQQQGESLLQGLTQKLNDVKASQKPKENYTLTGDSVIDKSIKARQKGAITSQINEIVDYVQKGELTAEQGRSLIDRINAKYKRSSGSGGTGKKKVNYKGVRTTAKAIKIPTLKIKIPKTRIPKYKSIKTKRVKFKK